MPRYTAADDLAVMDVVAQEGAPRRTLVRPRLRLQAAVRRSIARGSSIRGSIPAKWTDSERVPRAS
jgi:hypothetical protein